MGYKEALKHKDKPKMDNTHECGIMDYSMEKGGDKLDIFYTRSYHGGVLEISASAGGRSVGVHFMIH